MSPIKKSRSHEISQRLIPVEPIRAEGGQERIRRNPWQSQCGRFWPIQLSKKGTVVSTATVPFTYTLTLFVPRFIRVFTLNDTEQTRVKAKFTRFADKFIAGKGDGVRNRFVM